MRWLKLALLSVSVVLIGALSAQSASASSPPKFGVVSVSAATSSTSTIVVRAVGQGGHKARLERKTATGWAAVRDLRLGKDGRSTVHAKLPAGNVTLRLVVSGKHSVVQRFHVSGKPQLDLGRPSAPSAPVVTDLDQQLLVSWTKPTGNPFGEVREWKLIISSTGELRTFVGVTSYVWPMLTNGTDYTFQLEACTLAGCSDPSVSSVPVHPSGLPLMPAAPTVSSPYNSDQVTASWPVADGNGDPVSTYDLREYVGGSLAQTITTSAHSVTLPALPGSTYAFELAATNKNGESPWSPRSASVTAADSPGPVGPVTAHAGDANAAYFTFTEAPANGAPVTSHRVRIDGRTVVTPTYFVPGNASADGLTANQSYTFEVASCNVAGCGPFSAVSNPVTVYGVPDAPVLSGGTPSGYLLYDFTWTAPADNSSPITSYDFGDLDDGLVKTSATLPIPCGTTRTVRIRAENSAGAGPFSNPITVVSTPCPVVTVSRGASYTQNTDDLQCQTVTCYYVHVHVDNPPPGSYTLRASGVSGNGWTGMSGNDGDPFVTSAGSSVRVSVEFVFNDQFVDFPSDPVVI